MLNELWADLCQGALRSTGAAASIFAESATCFCPDWSHCQQTAIKRVAVRLLLSLIRRSQLRHRPFTAT